MSEQSKSEAKAEAVLDKASPELKAMLEGFGDAVSERRKELDPIPWDRATIQKEYRNCRNPFCPCHIKGYEPKLHGPYLYAYWKDKGKLKKKYIGRSIEDYKDKLSNLSFGESIGKKWTWTQWKKYHFIQLAADCGIEIATKYQEKVGLYGIDIFNETYSLFGEKKLRPSSIDWAFRVVMKAIKRNPELMGRMATKMKEQEQEQEQDENKK